MGVELDIKNELNDSAPDFHAAFIRTADDRGALRPADLLTINLDVPSMVATVIGALPRLKTLRESFVTALPTFDIATFDAIESYAEALAFAQTAFLAASSPVTDLPALLARATKMREQLVTDVTALARRGVVDAKRLADLKGGSGYLAISYDLGALVRMVRERWDEISSKSAIQLVELDEAESLYERITRAYGERSGHSTSSAVQANDRQRAYTLLVKAYDQARRAAQYIRWEEGDADKIVPSLYAGRGGGRPRGDSKPPVNGGQGDVVRVEPDPDRVEIIEPIEPVDLGMPVRFLFDNH